jgi:hypothetical protein
MDLRFHEKKHSGKSLSHTLEKSINDFILISFSLACQKTAIKRQVLTLENSPALFTM